MQNGKSLSLSLFNWNEGSLFMSVASSIRKTCSEMPTPSLLVGTLSQPWCPRWPVLASSYPGNIPEPLWKNPCLALSFLTRNSRGRTRYSSSVESRHDLSIDVHGWRCVIWIQALTFQALILLICQWRWCLIPPWLDLTSCPLLRETLPTRPV